MRFAPSLTEMLVTLGYDEEYEYEMETKPAQKNNARAIRYLYDIFQKHERDELSFSEALHVYTNMGYSTGVAIYFAEADRVECALGLEPGILGPTPLKWREQYPLQIREVLESTMHKQYVQEPNHPPIVSLMRKATDCFYDFMADWMQLEEREVFPGVIRKAGYSTFDHHYTEFGQDFEKQIGQVMYITFIGKRYEYSDSVIKERGRIKALVKLDEHGFVTKEQSELVQRVRQEYGL
jgi:hypothetical protein